MKDLKHYLALTAILSIGFVAFWIFNYNRQIQIVITILMSVSYILWGVIHHHLKKELHLRIFIEYFMVAIVTSVLVIFLLLRS